MTSKSTASSEWYERPAIEFGISDMATRTLRKSPEVSTVEYFYYLPEEQPPSSATVTLAANLMSFFLKLFKITGIPVPPPITVILGFQNGLPLPSSVSYHDDFHLARPIFR